MLPGLVDAHCHLSVAKGDDGWPTALDAAGTRANLAKAHAAGVTGIRDTGSPGSLALELIGTLDGVGLQACGRFLAPQDRYFPALHVPVPAEDLLDAALAEVRAGAQWVKLVADFTTFRPGSTPPEPTATYPLAAVERLVEAVHTAGARVAAHTTTRLVTDLIRAGVDSIEHGPALDESDLDDLAAGYGAWTPTLCAMIGEPQSDDPERQRRQAEIRDRLAYLLPTAIARGVTVMTGTDVVGTVPREVALLTDVGLTPTQALAAATTAARRFLGLPDLDDGEPADLVTYDGDPRDDPAILTRPVAVVRQGTRLR